MDQIGYLSETPATPAMAEYAKRTLALELVHIPGVDPFNMDAVKEFGEEHKKIKNVVVVDPSLAILFTRAKYGVAVLRQENTASEWKPAKVETTGMRLYTRDGLMFQNM
jgi:hypothetical protein